MRAIKNTFLVSLILAIALPPAGPEAQTKSSEFVPPHALTVTDIPYPNQVNAAGLVSLEVLLDSYGHITGVVVLRDIPGLTVLAQSAVNKWTFASATKNGRPIAAPLSVEVVFNTGILRMSNLRVSPPFATTPVEGLAYSPPVVQSANFSNYPTNSVAWGAVVLGARLDASGKILGTKVIRDVSSLTQPSIAALKTWAFSPATFGNSTIASRAIVAFVFRAAMSAAP